MSTPVLVASDHCLPHIAMSSGFVLNRSCQFFIMLGALPNSGSG